MAQSLDQDFSHLQDVLGTLPMVKRYVVLCLFFALDNSYSLDRVQEFLQESLARLAESFPYLAGQVVYEGRDESQHKTGVPVIIPLAPAIQVVHKDLRSDASFPSLSDLSKARYPFSMLDAATLTTPIAVSWSTDPHNDVAPVLILQANYVRGGLILTVMGNHTQMDMSGMGIVISLFAKACRNESFTAEEFQHGNQPRRSAIPLLDETYQHGPELDDITVKPHEPNAPNPLDSNPRWAYFHISPSSLSLLKTFASDQSIVPYISTDDAIAALIWQRLSSVRSSRLGPDAESTFARPISVRKYLKLTQYIGHMVDVVYCTLPSVHTIPVGTIAANLRQILNRDQKIIHHIRAFATILSRLDDKSKLINGANLDPQQDIVISSYANIRCCELDFGGILRKPIAARRPRMPVWPGLGYCMPKDGDGGIAVGLCVGEEDLIRLKSDSALKKFAEYVG